MAQNCRENIMESEEKTEVEQKKLNEHVDGGCEQDIFQLRYQEPNKGWSTHLKYFDSFVQKMLK